MSFVLGMRERAQGTVIALVNKADQGLGFWSPKVILVDLMGTCDKTSPALQKQLLARPLGRPAQ